jgi:hypothetical protein
MLTYDVKHCNADYEAYSVIQRICTNSHRVPHVLVGQFGATYTLGGDGVSVKTISAVPAGKGLDFASAFERCWILFGIMCTVE